MGKQGFTLLELLVSIALSIMIITAGYFFYDSQIQTRVTQERVIEMQQNLRAAMVLMDKDFRMAGYDPDGVTGAAITVATPGLLTFSASLDGDANGEDDDGDGTVDETDEGLLTETISYALFDDGGDGDMDMGRSRSIGAAVAVPVAVSENIQTLEFSYMLEDGSFVGTPTDLSAIVAVRFALIARTAREERGFINSAQYIAQYADGDRTWGPYNDGHRRRLLWRMVRCRNRGI
ncbi:PilW family protein [Desulfoluna sp.]|uniref:PilW family protein n=1 Tax=Desulfoluna sp. TaxID=2045199 RepID=UPI0026178D35|nr:prepilin-type N-terminal cleavage/methylation domain-containing protein [Desulfoluna sp.]